MDANNAPVTPNITLSDAGGHAQSLPGFVAPTSTYAQAPQLSPQPQPPLPASQPDLSLSPAHPSGQMATPSASAPTPTAQVATSTGLLPALSPEAARLGQSQPQAAQGQMPTFAQQMPMMHPGGQPRPGQQGFVGSPHGTPGGSQNNVFQAVMGAGPGQVPQDDVGGAGNVKVYASAYSQIPVFEAMIRNISVMRRMADSWVNATQILKVAGISKSVRTKILEKQVQTQMHEKVQGGYGKYQGTWIPLDRGRALAEQYGVLQFLAPIFDFVPPPTGPPALPMRGGSATPNAKTPGGGAGARMPGSAGSAGRLMSPYARQNAAGPPPPPPQFMQQQQPMPGQQDMMMGQPQMLYQQQNQPMQGMYYQPVGHPQPPQHMVYEQGRDPNMDMSGGMQMQPNQGGLAPPANINGHGNGMQGLPQPNEMYVDQYGQAHSVGMPSAAPISAEVDAPPPAKRARVDEPANGEEPQEGTGSEDDDDETRDRPPLPASFRLSTKPFKPRLSSESHRRRQQLLSLFQTDTVDIRSVFELGPNDKPDWDIDMVIDEQGHTALHWACALAKMDVISQLIELGADIHRGNYSGETPLIRSVLTTNHAEAGTFSQLLEKHLGESVRTLDHSYDSVIHHIALSAGLKGRAACARGYMAAVLGYIAQEQTKTRELAQSTPGNGNALAPAAAIGTDTISLKRLVDLQDLKGDTALNIAARIGSKPLVNLLLDAGADKTKANKLGLRPYDFGVEVAALQVSNNEAVVAALRPEVKRPEKRSADVLKNISALFEDVNRTFDGEMEKHVESLNSVEKNVRVATRSLAEKRQQVDAARQKLDTLEQQAARIDNAKRALEANMDWSGRTPLKGESSLPPAFGLVPPLAPAAGEPSSATPATDPPIPAVGEAGALTQLRRLAMWEDRMAKLLEERAAELEGDGADRAVKYRKVIALCAKVPVEQVDDVSIGAMHRRASRFRNSGDGGRRNMRRESYVPGSWNLDRNLDGQEIGKRDADHWARVYCNKPLTSDARRTDHGGRERRARHRHDAHRRPRAPATRRARVGISIACRSYQRAARSAHAAVSGDRTAASCATAAPCQRAWRSLKHDVNTTSRKESGHWIGCSGEEDLIVQNTEYAVALWNRTSTALCAVDVGQRISYRR